MNIDIHYMLDNYPADFFIGQSIGILGIKGSGKSNTAAVFMEEFLTANLPILIVDIAGEYWSLQEKYPHITVIGKSIETNVQIAITLDNAANVAETAYLNGASTVFDLSGYEDADREQMLNLYINRIWALSAECRIPLIIFLEEATNFIPQSGDTSCKRTLIRIATEGRKRGLSLIMISQRSAQVNKNALTQADILFLHKVRHSIDMDVYKKLIPYKPGVVEEKVNKLKVGEALVLIEDKVLRCTIRLRHTKHIGSTPTTENIPVQQLSLFELLQD